MGVRRHGEGGGGRATHGCTRLRSNSARATVHVLTQALLVLFLASYVKGEVHTIAWRTNTNFQLNIVTGDTVTWIWADNAPHTVRSPPSEDTDPGSLINFPPGLDFSPRFFNTTFSFTFNETGSFDFDCEVHPNNMRGTIEVEAPDHIVSWSNPVQFDLDILVNESVMWIWSDAAPHTVTSPPSNETTNGSFIDFPPNFTRPDGFTDPAFRGVNYSHTFTEAGEHDFNCRIHATGMIGTIRVFDPDHIITWGLFAPATTTFALDILVGETVTWLWEGAPIPHTITSPPSNDTGAGSLIDFPPGYNGTDTANLAQFRNTRYSYTFMEEGEYLFDCRVHPINRFGGTPMFGTIRVFESFPVPMPVPAPTPMPTAVPVAAIPVPTPAPAPTTPAPSIPGAEESRDTRFGGLGLFGLIGVAVGGGLLLVLVIICIVHQKRKRDRFNRIYWEHAPSGKRREPPRHDDTEMASSRRGVDL